MAALAPSPNQTSDLLKNMSLESQPKPVDIPEVTNKPSSVKYNASEAGSGPSPVVDRSTAPVLQEFMDPNMCYFPNGYASPYYFGGYGGHTNEWEDYPRYDGIEGVYGENGTMMYHPGYGYPPYGAYPPGGPAVSNMGPDGQLYGPQQYQYAAPYYQQHNQSSVGQCNSNNQTPVSKEEVSTSIPPDQGTVPVETPNGISNGVTNGHAKTNGAPFAKPSNQPALALNSNGSHDRGIFPSYQESQFTFDGTRTSGWLDDPVLDRQRKTTSGPLPSSGPRPFTAKSQNTQPLGHVMGLHPSRPNSGIASPPAFMNRIYSNSRMYNHSAGTLGLSEAYGSNSYDSRLNGRGWLPFDNKYKPRGRGNRYLYFSNENMDALNEQNKGPRASRFKNQRSFPTGVTLAVKGQNITLNATEDSSNTPARDQYNRAEFVTNCSEAKFFVIKSYSEDDIHKSIKYNVWASTPNGNKKLDAAYQEAKAKSNGSPIFLLFSVNTSGQFCGLAEMMGPVDFNKTLDYWQQDKWNGCFPVKWHIIKDVPNNSLKHIILENNDNKPVTNSRDTQEVNFEQGLEILKIFKDYVSKTCLLDDFEFYESRQKLMQESRSKLRQLKQIQKPIWDGKMNDTIADDKEVMKPKPNKLTEPITILQKDSTHCLLDRKPLEENALVVEAVLNTLPLGPKATMVVEAAETANGTEPICEKKVPNGVANGC